MVIVPNEERLKQTSENSCKQVIVLDRMSVVLMSGSRLLGDTYLQSEKYQEALENGEKS
jgi:hypothetical protein